MNESEKNMISDLGYDIDYLENELVEHDLDFKKYDGVICNGLFLHNDIRKFSRLKFVQVTSAGLDRLPMEYIEQKNITVYSAKDVYSIPIAEWVILKILEIYKFSNFFFENQVQRMWQKNRDVLELNKKTAAIIGVGSIGKEIAKRLKGFGVYTIGIGRSFSNQPESLLDEYYTTENLDSILKRSDIVILTLPLNSSTNKLFDYERISYMRDKSILINVSRGEIINENDLILHIRENKFLGCALDVFENEPLNPDHELWSFSNVLISPHNSFVSENNKSRLFIRIRENLRWESENFSSISQK